MSAAPAEPLAKPKGVKLVIVAAVAENGVIGRGDALPWRVSSDLKRFRAITWGKPILMGRRTFESLPRVLPGRTSIVITRDAGFVPPEGVLAADSIDEALALGADEAKRLGTDEIIVMGGAQLYAQLLPLVDRLRLTLIHGRPQGDVHFPPYDAAHWREIAREGPHQGEKDEFAFTYVDYERV